MLPSFAARIAGMVLIGALATALPISASAQTSSDAGPTQVHYSTTITSVYGSKYPIAGHLDLEIFSSGIVRGYYHNAYQKAFIQVVGGRDGNYLWFDIGPSLVDLGLGLTPNARLHVVATLDSSNAFRGQIYPTAVAENIASTASSLGSQSTSLAGPTALTSPTESPDQYVFFAKPVDKSPEDYTGTY